MTKKVSHKFIIHEPNSFYVRQFENPIRFLLHEHVCVHFGILVFPLNYYENNLLFPNGGDPYLGAVSREGSDPMEE